MKIFLRTKPYSQSAVIQTLLDLIYPPKCALCGDLTHPGLCPTCQATFTPAPSPIPTKPPLTSITAPFLYKDLAAEAVKKLKFDRRTPLAEPLSQILHKAAQSIPHDLVIPVPIARTRRSERGFNQSELLAQAFPKTSVHPHLLRRTRYTKPQVGLNAKQRHENLKDAFLAPEPLPNQRILLLDDVITTGGTAVACAQELIRQGASEVHLLTFAIQLGN